MKKINKKTLTALAIWLIMGTAIAQSNYIPQLSAILGVEGWPVDVKIGDVTGDGINDIVMINNGYTETANNNHIVVIPMGAGGSFNTPITIAYTDVVGQDRSLQLLNVDDDDALEIVAGVDRTLVIANFNALGAFDVQTMNTFRRNDRLVAIDINLDGQQDLIAAQTSGQLMAVGYLTNGNGGLQLYTAIDLSNQGDSFELDVADVTGDGREDLLVMHGGSTFFNTQLWVHAHDGLNDFSVPVGYSVGGAFDFVIPKQITTGDFNGDDLTDVLLVQSGGPSYLLTQNLAGGLNPYAELNIANRLIDVNSVDVDGNGEDDVVSIHDGTLFTPSSMSLMLQDNGMLSNPDTVNLPQNIAFDLQALALGDINGDGCTDIVMADALQGLVAYRGLNCLEYADLQLTGRKRGYTAFNVTLTNLESNIPVEEGEVYASIVIEAPFYQQMRLDVIIIEQKSMPEGCDLSRLDFSVYEIECEARVLNTGDVVNWGFHYETIHHSVEDDVRVTGTLDANPFDPDSNNNDFALVMGME
ncbi:FG-GAP repeat domain-containing protein [Marinicella sp. W31]|uniref:FG-GAP repeat domain-containing protein n=1 Tax=Marinicella sp. W31 TaxID=3023713 RepID=UPI003757D3DC